jgi:hypothetical protein
MEQNQENKDALIKAGKERFQKIYEGLKQPFPAEAYSVDSSRGFNLTSIKAQYVVERLNEVCGIDGWELTGDYKEVEGGVLFIGHLIVNDGHRGHKQEAIGFAQFKKNVGDAYKGAKTDALSKSASLFGLGNEVFKGNVAPPVKTRGKSSLKAANNDF